MFLIKLILFLTITLIFSGCGKIANSELVAQSEIICSFTGKVNYNVSKNVTTDFDSNDVTTFLNVETSSCKNIKADTQLPIIQSRIVRLDQTINFVDNKSLSQTVKVDGQKLSSMFHKGFSSNFNLVIELFDGKITQDNQRIEYSFKANSIRNNASIQALEAESTNNELVSPLVLLLKVQ